MSGAEPRAPNVQTTLRGRRNIALDLKQAEAVATALELIAKADILIEGFRPGVMERLGPRPRCGDGQEPAADLRPHDRLGPGWPDRQDAPATTSTTSR